MYLYAIRLSNQATIKNFVSVSNDVKKVRDRVERMASNSGLTIDYFGFIGYIDEINPLF